MQSLLSYLYTQMIGFGALENISIFYFYSCIFGFFIERICG